MWVQRAGKYTVHIDALYSYANKAKTQVELSQLPPCSRLVCQCRLVRC